MQLPLEILFQLFAVVESDVIWIYIFIDEKDGYTVEEKRIVVLSVLRSIDQSFYAVLYLSVKIEESDGDDNGNKIQDVQYVYQSLLGYFIV